MAGLMCQCILYHRAAATFSVRAHGRHSQRLSATPLRPWVAVEKIGSVLCAHCNCMAGLGEACSHIAAALFVLEANVQARKSMSCMSLPCLSLSDHYI